MRSGDLNCFSKTVMRLNGEQIEIILLLRLFQLKKTPVISHVPSRVSKEISIVSQTVLKSTSSLNITSHISHQIYIYMNKLSELC